MFIGHVGVALAAKRAYPAPSLGTYLAAAQWPDFAWAAFLLLGWETVRIAPGDTRVTPLAFLHYPWSHSLAAVLAWAALWGGAYALGRRDRRGARWLALLILSHWVLDAVSHRPDLPLWPGGATLVGLGLWDSRAATLLAEGGLFAVGLALYARATPGRSRGQACGLATLAVLLVVLYAGSVWGPPPPSAAAIAASDLAGSLFVVLAAWVDRRPAR